MDAEGAQDPSPAVRRFSGHGLNGALCQTLLAATSFTNKSLRALITGLLGSDYRPTQMTYDLRRLRLAGLIRRLPNTYRYTLTSDGIPSPTPSSTTACSFRLPLPTSLSTP